MLYIVLQYAAFQPPKGGLLQPERRLFAGPKATFWKTAVGMMIFGLYIPEHRCSGFAIRVNSFADL